jgi:AraC family transcriptional regulator
VGNTLSDAPSRANPVVGVGQFIGWNGGCIFIGRHDSQIPVHAHQAIQLVVGRSAKARVHTAEQAPWIEYSAAIIASRQPHGLDVREADYGVVLFVEPETRAGQAIREHHLQGDGVVEVGSESLVAATQHLFDVWLEQRGRSAIAEAAQKVVQVLAAGAEPAVVTDPRILTAIAYVNDHIADELTLDDVATHAYLSPSRFRHVFAEQTGMGLRPYILWRRFLHVWDLLMAGQTLSTAAHSAGFADAAHLTRTCRRTFGFVPSAMLITSAPPPSRAATPRE